MRNDHGRFLLLGGRRTVRPPAPAGQPVAPDTSWKQDDPSLRSNTGRTGSDIGRIVCGSEADHGLPRYELLMTPHPVPDETIMEIVDDIFLPLVRYR
jgi:hypothetical protein